MSEQTNNCVAFINLISFLVFMIGFMVIPSIGYYDIKVIDGGYNDYNEWRDFYIIQLIIDAFVVIATIFFFILMFFEHLGAVVFQMVLWSFTWLSFSVCGATGTMLFYKGNDYNKFGKGWEEYIIDSVEKHYDCCFLDNGTARLECKCNYVMINNDGMKQVRKLNETMNIFNETLTNENDEKETNEECGDCETKFNRINKGFILSCFILDYFLAIIMFIGPFAINSISNCIDDHFRHGYNRTY